VRDPVLPAPSGQIPGGHSTDSAQGAVVGEALAEADAEPADGAADADADADVDGSADPLGTFDGSGMGVGSGMKLEGIPRADMTRIITKMRITTRTHGRPSRSLRGGSAPR